MLIATHRLPEFGGVFHFLGQVAHLVGLLFVFTVTVGVLFLLVRFLLVATKAAQLYVAQNASPTLPEKASPAPSTRPRTPKAPPKS